MERATGIEPVLPTWESKLSILYSQYLQNHSEKMRVHALHTVHAVPDLRIAAGRLRDDVSRRRVVSVAVSDQCHSRSSSPRCCYCCGPGQRHLRHKGTWSYYYQLGGSHVSRLRHIHS